MTGRQNALFWGRGHKSMEDVMEEREKELLSPMEILILNHLRKSDDGFIAVNETELYDQNPKELFKALNSLVEKNIIKKKNYEAVAYEWTDTSILYL
jgi:DNA-binding HxlR family transcriptional regulator